MATILISTALNIGLGLLSRAFAPTQNFQQEGPRLKESQITSSAEGVPIPKLFGRTRMGGNLIWSTEFKETVIKESQSSGGGKGGGGGGSSTTVTTYKYSASFAVALCEGSDSVQLGRIWADGKLVDTESINVRFYSGTQTQEPDSFIETVEGFGNVPAYRGIVYLVFEEIPLEDYGNRIPQINAEIIAPLKTLGDDDLENLVEGVCLIPASGEFAYGTLPYSKSDGKGNTTYENTFAKRGIADAVTSFNDLQGFCPNTNTVLLVVSWFGNDLRAGNCEIRPKVELKNKVANSRNSSIIHNLNVNPFTRITIINTNSISASVEIRVTSEVVETIVVPAFDSVDYTFSSGGVYTLESSDGPISINIFDSVQVFPNSWQVSGIDRYDALEVAKLPDGSLAYGGTPSDSTVYEIIQEIKARGWRVFFYPFIMMDQLDGNGLPDPYGGVEQAQLPWRGRITCYPAIGQPGTVDKTVDAETQIDNWFGDASVSDVGTGIGNLPNWLGDEDEFGYRRMVLHYARLCDLAGGVDGFLIGTELPGLTSVRSGPTGPFPAVDRFKVLAGDVRSIVGSSTKIGYAADWSEYHSYRPSDGSGDVFFNLDPLWSDSNIDFVGIDNYLPISDWRSGGNHADYDEDGGITSIYNIDYLKSNIEGGEYYDWFYASYSDRENQVRTPITDTAYSKDWVFRQKDIRNWWLNTHVDRPSGVESSATSWIPQSKPVYFTEFGTPASDNSPNQPNVFYDPKSSESQLPYFSTGQRDDLVQRKYLEAMFQYWRDNSPTSTVYGEVMTDPTNMFIWTWDSRPYPQFPYRSDVWQDAPNWQLGHWLTGRLGVVPLSLLVKEICLLSGIDEECIDVSGLFGSNATVRGYLIDKNMSVRDMLEPLAACYLFDGFESQGKVKFVLRNNKTPIVVDPEDLVSSDSNKTGFSLTRSQETELPDSIKISFYNEPRDYAQSAIDGKKLTGYSKNSSSIELPIVLTVEYARSLSDILIQEAWQGRTKVEINLPDKYLRLDPSDLIQLELNGKLRTLRITEIDGGESIKINAETFDPSIYSALDYGTYGGNVASLPNYGSSILDFADIPLLTGDEERPWAPRVIGYQSPWPGTINLYKDDNAGGFALNTQVTTPAAIGELVADLYSGKPWRWDRDNEVFLDMYSNDQLLSTTELAVLNGANSIAVENETGNFEILQFQNAQLIGEKRYRLSKLLRGQLGSEQQIRNPAPSGSRVIYLDQTDLIATNLEVSHIDVSNDYRYGPATLPLDSDIYLNETRAFEGIGIKPYAPVHLDAVKQTNNEILLTWQRRTRFGADGWLSTEVPINEDSESYELDIISSGVVVRTEILNTRSYNYAVADQVTDLGSAGNIFSFKVYQISSILGRGYGGEGSFDG